LRLPLPSPAWNLSSIIKLSRIKRNALRYILGNVQRSIKTLWSADYEVYSTLSCYIAKSKLRPRHATLRQSPQLLANVTSSSSSTNVNRQQMLERWVSLPGITSAQQVRHCLLPGFWLY